jgi:hypothetical protein
VLPEVREGAGEFRQYVFSIERILIREQVHGTVVAIDDSPSARRVDDPHEARAGGEPVAHLGLNLSGTVARCYDLDDEIGGERRILTRRQR